MVHRDYENNVLCRVLFDGYVSLAVDQPPCQLIVRIVVYDNTKLIQYLYIVSKLVGQTQQDLVKKFL